MFDSEVEILRASYRMGFIAGGRTVDRGRTVEAERRKPSGLVAVCQQSNSHDSWAKGCKASAAAVASPAVHRRQTKRFDHGGKTRRIRGFAIAAAVPRSRKTSFPRGKDIFPSRRRSLPGNSFMASATWPHSPVVAAIASSQVHKTSTNQDGATRPFATASSTLGNRRGTQLAK